MPDPAPSKVRTTRYFTFTRTCSFKRVVDEFLKDNQVLQIEAVRNMLNSKEDHPQPVDWIHHLDRSVSDIDLNYFIKKHGQFSKDAVDEFLKASGCKDFWLKSATILVDSEEVRTAAHELLREEGVPAEALHAGDKFVAYFENTPCRRFPQEEMAPEWVQRVSDFQRDEERELGFEPSVLDLVHVLPFDIWRDTEGKTRISRAYKREVERFKEALNVHNDSHFSRRRVMNAIFPKEAGIVGGRVEELTGKNVWVVVEIEDSD